MRRGMCRLAVLALTLWLGSPATEAQQRTETKQHPSPVRTMFELLDEIDTSPKLSPLKVEELLKVTLQPAPAESNEYFYVFKGHGGLWKAAELRLPRGGDGSKFVLVLEPATPIPMDQVTKHFGDGFALEAPNPNAGAQAMIGYSYNRAAGKLRFSFTNMREYAARIILFDRA